MAERYIKVSLYECDPDTNDAGDHSMHSHKVLFEDEASAIDPSYVADRAKNLGWRASQKLEEILKAEQDACEDHEFEDGLCINCGAQDDREAPDYEPEIAEAGL